MGSSGENQDAAFKNERASSHLCENTLKPYEPALSVLSFVDPSFALGELLPVAGLYQVFKFEQIHHLHLDVMGMLLHLKAVWVHSAFPKRRRILNQMSYLIFELDKLQPSTGMYLDNIS